MVLSVSTLGMVVAPAAVSGSKRACLPAQVLFPPAVPPGTASEAGVEAADSAQLDARIQARDEKISALSGEPRTLACRQAIIDLAALRQELSQTWVFRPDLSLTAGLSWQPGSTSPLAASAGLSISFSPSDIATDERADISQDIADKEKEVSLEREASLFQRDILAQALSVAKETLNTRKAELAQAQTTAAQGELLLSQGRWTSIELEQARLNVDSARAGVLSAAAAVLAAQSQILLLYGA